MSDIVIPKTLIIFPSQLSVKNFQTYVMKVIEM